MCGIFGYSFKNGKMSPARRAILAANLARYNDERGGDSWGVVGLDDDEPQIARGLGDLSDNAFELCEHNTLFAHTRWSSCGETNLKNAHPFKIGNIVGAHNGMIHNHEELCKKYRRKFEVDSMHIFAHLNEGRSFEELIGYGAIEWIYRDEPNEIYLSKLVDGELAIYGVGDDEDNTDGVIWSSSFKHLQKAMSAAGIDNVFRYEVRRGNVFMVKNGALKQDDMKVKITKYTPPPEKSRSILDMKVNDYRMWHTFYSRGLLEHQGS